MRTGTSWPTGMCTGETRIRPSQDPGMCSRKNSIPPGQSMLFWNRKCAVAMPDGEDGVIIYSSDQGVYDTQHECMLLLGLPAEKVKVRNKLVGGGFGGKEDVTVQHHAAMIAYLAKRPVKVKLTRPRAS